MRVTFRRLSRPRIVRVIGRRKRTRMVPGPIQFWFRCGSRMKLTVLLFPLIPPIRTWRLWPSSLPLNFGTRVRVVIKLVIPCRRGSSGMVSTVISHVTPGVTMIVVQGNPFPGQWVVLIHTRLMVSVFMLVLILLFVMTALFRGIRLVIMKSIMKSIQKIIVMVKVIIVFGIVARKG